MPTAPGTIFPTPQFDTFLGGDDYYRLRAQLGKRAAVAPGTIFPSPQFLGRMGTDSQLPQRELSLREVIAASIAKHTGEQA